MNILNKLRNNQFVFMLLCACWDHFWYVSILRLTALRLLLAQLLLLLYCSWHGLGLDYWRYLGMALVHPRP
jgi:hypothetical protein